MLERAFRDTYSLELSDVFGDLDLALGTYRKAVSAVIPELTRVAWNLNKDDLMKGTLGKPGGSSSTTYPRRAPGKSGDGKYKGPGAGARILAFFIRILPKVGPLSALAFKPPTKQTASLFELSFDRTMDRISRDLLAEAGSGETHARRSGFRYGEADHPRRVPAGGQCVREADGEAGGPPGEGAGRRSTPALLPNVLEFYRDPKAPVATRRRRSEGMDAKLQAALGEIAGRAGRHADRAE